MASYKIGATVPDDSKHIGDIECIVCHGDKVYTGADDGMVKVWTLDLEPVQEIQAHQYMVYHIAINNDNTKLYSCSNDGSIHSWSLPGLEKGGKLLGHFGAVRKLRFLPNGTLCSGDECGIVCMWTGGEGTPRKLNLAGEEIWDLAVEGELIYTARDRDLVVSVAKEGLKSVTNKATVPGRAPLTLVEDRVYFVSHEGTEVLVHYTQEKKFEKIAEMKGHEMIINAMASSKSGGLLYTGGYDNAVRVWDLKTHEGLGEVPLDAYVNCVAEGPDDNSFYAGGANSMIVKIVKK